VANCKEHEKDENWTIQNVSLTNQENFNKLKGHKIIPAEKAQNNIMFTRKSAVMLHSARGLVRTGNVPNQTPPKKKSAVMLHNAGGLVRTGNVPN
jgi:hypothetical protein